MKLYIERDPAPNPRRVGIFLREKGIDEQIETIRVDLRKREHKSAEHLARNTLGQVPTLELDDGRRLSESVSICRYLEALHPRPALFGTQAFEQAFIDQWIRRIEMVVMSPVGQFWRHAHPLTATLLEQHTTFGESNRPLFTRALEWLDKDLTMNGPFIAGLSFSMADIVAVTTIDFAELIGLQIPPACTALGAWRERMRERPSMAMPATVHSRYATTSSLALNPTSDSARDA